ncbi:MAG: M55 family metallopeptidase [Thermomicrobiales bacterium]
MKVLISADMEGTAGVSSWVHVTPHEGRSARATSSIEYERARSRMTREVNAAAEGAFEAGATGVVVADAHGGKRNLIPDELDSRIRFVTGSDNELGMMQAIDEDGIRAVFFTGYHARAGTPGGPLAHTSTGWVHDVRVNGTSMGEYGMNAIIAGHFGVPVALVTGDNLAVAQTRQLLGEGVVGVVTKQGYSLSSAQHLAPADACGRIRAGAVEALGKLDELHSYSLPDEATVEIDLDHQARADSCSYLPGVTRAGERTISIQPANGLEFGKFWRAILAAGAQMGM